MGLTDQEKASFAEVERFYIHGAFGNEMVEQVIAPMAAAIDRLRGQKSAAIEIHINSSGGYCKTAFHLVRMMEGAKSQGVTVITKVVLDAYSAASMVAIAGTPGERWISAEAEHLIHYGSFDAGWKHTPEQLSRSKRHADRHLKNLAAHYDRHARVPDLLGKLKDDCFFVPAKQAIRWGLADKIWGGEA